ncbi:TolC family protein [Planctomycetales bacterium ZRK34]|nr:TolC family protein [Planctomycetales bacterium ZRK34]
MSITNTNHPARGINSPRLRPRRVPRTAPRGVCSARFNTIATLFTLLTLAGCAPPDHWQVLDEQVDRAMRRQTDTPVELSDSLIPTPQKNTTLPALEAAGPLEVSVEQAALLALSNNRDLAVQQLNPVITGAFEQIERGRFDPQLFASAEYNEERSSEVARSTSARFDVEGNEASGEVGIRQELPTGTDIEASVTQDRSISNRAPEQQEARLGLTVTQSLLRGFGPAVNLASIRQAELDTLASKYILRGFAETLLAETEIAYWDYILAHERIAIFERSLDVARQQLDVVEQRIEVGVVARTEAAAARAEVARREQALIDARSSLESTRLQLLRLMNPSRDGSLDREVVATTKFNIDPQAITDQADRVTLAQRMRPEINEARLRLDQDRLQTIVTRNGLLPRLDVFVTMGRSGFDNTFRRSFQNLNDGTYDFTAGVSFSHYLGNRAAEGRDLAARAERWQSVQALDNLRQLIRLDVRLAVNEAERARKQIAASATTRQFEEQTVQAEHERFDVGTSTALLVAQAQRDLLAAQIAEVEAVVGYRIALVNLYLAEGTLLERRGITLAAPADHGKW